MAIRVILEDNRSCSDQELLHNIWTHLQLIHEQNQQIMLTQEQLVQGLNEVSAQVNKIKGESSATLQKVSDLEAALNNQGNVSPAVEDAFNALKAQVQVVDDLIADTTTPDTGSGGETGSTL